MGGEGRANVPPIFFSNYELFLLAIELERDEQKKLLSIYTLRDGSNQSSRSF
jgi:hypothetical protein